MLSGVTRYNFETSATPEYNRDTTLITLSFMMGLRLSVDEIQLNFIARELGKWKRC